MLDTGFIVMNLAKAPKAKQVSILIIYINNHLYQQSAIQQSSIQYKQCALP